MPSSLLPIPADGRRQFISRVAARVTAQRGIVHGLAARFKMVWATYGSSSAAWGWDTTYGGGMPGGRYGLYGTLPGSQINYVREVGDPALNAVVSLCLNWIVRQLQEPRLEVVWVKADGTETPRPNHRLVQLVERPNEDYTGRTMLAAVAKGFLTSGSAHLIKARGAGGAGQPFQLWYVPYWEMSPRWGADGSNFITDWWYRPGGKGPGQPIPKEDVIHFQFDLNPYNQGRTSSQPTFPVLRSIYADNEGETYQAALLKNMGVPGAILSPKQAGPNEIETAMFETQDQRETLEELWVAKFTGDNRGKPFIGNIPIDVQTVGLSPKELDLGSMRDDAVEKICACFGLHPTLLFGAQGRSQGLDSGGQHDEARKAAYEDCIMPMLCAFADTLQHQLLPDLESNPERLRVRWDYSQVQCLQEDQDDLYTRAVTAYQGGILMRDEARDMVGLPPVPNQTAADAFTPDPQDPTQAQPAQT